MTVASLSDKAHMKDGESNGLQHELTRGSEIIGATTVLDNADSLQRRLGNRQIQLIAIGMYMTTTNFLASLI